MLDTVTGLRWIYFIAAILALASIIKTASVPVIILHIIAAILAIPGISKLFRPRKATRAAVLCVLASFIIMGIAHGLGENSNGQGTVEVITTPQFNEAGYLSADDVLIPESYLGNVDGVLPTSPEGSLNNGTGIVQIDAAQGMTLHFIDVGQGDSTLVESNGHYMLIDMGPAAAADALLEYLEELNIETLDTLVITHPHADHVNVTVLSRLISRFDINEVRIPDTTSSTGHALLAYAMDIIDEADLDVEITTAGDSWQVGGVNVKAVAPNSNYYDELNDYSLVLHIATGESSALICGDAEVVSENEMVFNRHRITADILRTGHHGSSTSSSTLFLAAVRPKYAVISCGAGNEYGHPHTETLSRLALFTEKNIYRTDKQGTIVAYCDTSGNISWSENQ